jgi:hypothetical protein
MGRFLAASVDEQGQTGEVRPILRATLTAAPKEKAAPKDGFCIRRDAIKV